MLFRSPSNSFRTAMSAAAHPALTPLLPHAHPLPAHAAQSVSQKFSRFCPPTGLLYFRQPIPANHLGLLVKFSSEKGTCFVKPYLVTRGLTSAVETRLLISLSHRGEHLQVTSAVQDNQDSARGHLFHADTKASHPRTAV